MTDSVFTKMIKGEIPCNKVYEDDKTLAFLDHSPKIPGHSVVIPKKQIAYVWDLSPQDYQALMETVKKVGQRIKEVLGPKWVGMQVEGVGVEHAHVHVFPFSSTEEYRQLPSANTQPSTQELVAMAQKLAF